VESRAMILRSIELRNPSKDISGIMRVFSFDFLGSECSLKLFPNLG
jgi:hypothetical protein